MNKLERKIKKALTVVLSAGLVFGTIGNTGTEVFAEENTATYVPGVIYTMNESELAAKGEAPEGLEWDVVTVSSHVDGYYDQSVAICGITEHTHSSATEADCQGYVFTCTEAEHVHSDRTGACYSLSCTQEEHRHSIRECFFGWLCGKTEHSHGESCYSLICTQAEHTHTAYGGSCYTQKVCDIPEHVHSIETGCYQYVEPIQAVISAS